MNNDLTKKLVKRFPVLYQDFYSPMSVTCMCWGFDHGDGWFDIIWQLSLAIEDELNYSWLQERLFLFRKVFAKKWNDLIYKLSPVRQSKYRMAGKGTHEDPYHQELVHRDPPPWDEKIAQFLFGEMTTVGRFPMERVALKNLVITNPKTGFAVEQVKEKFGTLRFYCPGNDRIYRLIRFAEDLSGVTCEFCGETGKTRGGGWIRTLCDKCEDKRNSE